MYKYKKQYSAALDVFKDTYLILYIGMILSFAGISYLIKQKNYTQVFEIYLIVSIITVISTFIFWYYMCFLRVKNYTFNISETEVEINNKKIHFTEFNSISRNKRNDLLLITNQNIRYRIYHNIDNYNEILSKLNTIMPIQEKSDFKEKFVYATRLFLFIVFMITNITYIVIPIGFFLLYTYITGFINSLRMKVTKSFSISLINILTTCFVFLKLSIHIIRLIQLIK
jgi:hypothetical protein